MKREEMLAARLALEECKIWVRLAAKFGCGLRALQGALECDKIKARLSSKFCVNAQGCE